MRTPKHCVDFAKRVLVGLTPHLEAVRLARSGLEHKPKIEQLKAVEKNSSLVARELGELWAVTTESTEVLYLPAPGSAPDLFHSPLGKIGVSAPDYFSYWDGYRILIASHDLCVVNLARFVLCKLRWASSTCRVFCSKYLLHLDLLSALIILLEVP